MGMVVVARVANGATSPPAAMMTSGFERTRSIARSGSRSGLPSAKRSSKAMFRPSVYPSASNARRTTGKASVSGLPKSRTPTREILLDCASARRPIAPTMAPARNVRRVSRGTRCTLSRRLGARQPRALDVGADVADDVALHHDLHLVVLDVPVGDGGQHAGQPLLMRDDPAPAVDERAGIGLGEAVTFLDVVTGHGQQLTVGRHAGRDARQRVAVEDDAALASRWLRLLPPEPQAARPALAHPFGHVANENAADVAGDEDGQWDQHRSPRLQPREIPELHGGHLWRQALGAVEIERHRVRLVARLAELSAGAGGRHLVDLQVQIGRAH